MMLKLLLTIPFFASFSFAQDLAQPKAKQLDLSALPAQTQTEILNQFPNLKGKNFRQSDLDGLVRYLVTKEQFEGVQILKQVQDKASNDSEHYFLNVGKTRRISKLIFTGMKSISEGEIRREFVLAEKSIFDQQSLIEAGERIRRMYQDRGFLNAVIDLEFAKLAPTEIQVQINVKEGIRSTIRSIELRSNNPEFKNQYLAFLNDHLLKEPLTDQTLMGIKKDLRESLNKNHYYQADLIGPEVTMSGDDLEAKLTFGVTNSDQIFLEIEGEKQELEGEILDSLELDTFFSANPSIGPELSSKIKDFYLSRGYSRVEILTEEREGKSPHSKVISFKVVEGPKVQIKEIRFNGKYTLSEKEYSNFVFEHSSDLVNSKQLYNRDHIENGLKNLVIDRQNQGFLQAKVISSKTVYQGKDKNEIVITVNFDEGPLTILDIVQFDGTSSFTEAQLLSVIGLKNNQPVKLNQLEEGIQKLKDFYRNSGYLEMNLLNEKEDLIRYNSDATLATLKFKVYEGPKVIVAGILVEGNSITKDYVILKELDFAIGDTLTPQLIEESTNRLQRLGHFTFVDIRTLEAKTQVSKRTVVVKVSDRDPGLFNMGIGANNERELTIRGYMGLAYRNLMGTGRGASARFEGNYNIADIKFPERKITFGYLEPYLFDSRVKGRINYTQSVAISDFDLRKATELKQISWSVEQDLTSHISLSYDIWNSSQYRDFPIDPENHKIPNNELVIVTTGPTLDIDFRDHPFNPTKGTFTRLNAEYSTPDIGSSNSIQYFKTMGTITHYKGFYKPGWVVANSVRGGYLKNMASGNDRADGVPYDKKGLILGGQSSIRGFQPGEAFPNAFDFQKDPSNYDPTSGIYYLKTSATMYMLKSELRFPIKGNFGGALFYDGGAVYLKDIGMDDPYRDAVGLALRYSTPVGAVSFEWGYKLDKKSDRREGQFPFYFSIGTF